MKISLIGLPPLYAMGLRQILGENGVETSTLPLTADCRSTDASSLHSAQGYIVSASALAAYAPLLMRRMDCVLLLTLSGIERSGETHGGVLRSLSPLADTATLRNTLAEFIRMCRGKGTVSKGAAISHHAALDTQQASDCSHKMIPLTRRELEVVAHTARGISSKDCAKALGISESTVLTHRKNINRKLGVRGMAALVHWAMTHGIV